MKDKVIIYEDTGEIFTVLRHFCLDCDKPVLLAISEMKVNALFFCTYCGLDSRMSQEMIEGVPALLAEHVPLSDAVPSEPGKRMN